LARLRVAQAAIQPHESDCAGACTCRGGWRRACEQPHTGSAVAACAAPRRTAHHSEARPAPALTSAPQQDEAGAARRHVTLGGVEHHLRLGGAVPAQHCMQERAAQLGKGLVPQHGRDGGAVELCAAGCERQQVQPAREHARLRGRLRDQPVREGVHGQLKRGDGRVPASLARGGLQRRQHRVRAARGACEREPAQHSATVADGRPVELARPSSARAPCPASKRGGR
jgi:hypothetical protein